MTGCAGGIGGSLVGALARRGHLILATDIDRERLGEQARSAGWPAAQVRLARLDVTSPESWKHAVAEIIRQFGRLDVLMNVAGHLKPGWIQDTDASDVRRHFSVNVEGPILGTQAAIAPLRRSRGHIVNIASLAALAPVPGISLYSASKYALRAFSLAAAQELRPQGISVTVVCPDAVDTPMLDVQLGREEAALTFSGPRPLKVSEVCGAIIGALSRRPLELFIPRSRGWLARVADVFPGVGTALAPLLRRKGLKAQRRLQAARG